jgi:hypothetical protein
MKILSFNAGTNDKKQIVVMTMTMHVINTDKTSKSPVRRFPASISKEWKMLEEKEYSIQYPKNWCLEKPGTTGQNFILFSQPSSLNDRFRDNVNLLTQHLTDKNINLDKFVEISVRQVRTMVVNSVIIENERINTGGQELHKLIYTGDSGRLNLKFVQYYWIKNEKAYILTLTCDANQFDKHKKIVQRIMGSFKLQ